MTKWSTLCCRHALQVVMAPHQQAEEFISSYRKLLREDMDVNNFQKVLEMKVRGRGKQAECRILT